jgi:hypothetical protein
VYIVSQVDEYRDLVVVGSTITRIYDIQVVFFYGFQIGKVFRGGYGEDDQLPAFMGLPVLIYRCPVRDFCQFFQVGHNKIVPGMMVTDPIPQELLRRRDVGIIGLEFFKVVVLAIKCCTA